MKSKPYMRQIEEYNEKYGKIPIDSDSILSYLENKLKLTEKDFAKIREADKYVASIPWNTLRIILPIIPKPSPRPRYSRVSGQFYVTGAAENKKLLKYYIEEAYQIIYTQTHFSLVTYLPTPISSMNRQEIYRAENKTIVPISNPDWDNLGKTYSDMIQNILILNDNIITKGLCEKYYSVKPRVEITIKYQMGFDSKFNKRRTESSKSYKEAVETGNIIELYTEGREIW
jgi:Holliday junction resolvase RusA-like endonuclease